MNATPATRSLEGPASKITPRHLDRRAIVYVRQSHPQQVVRHPESTRPSVLSRSDPGLLTISDPPNRVAEA